jgi:hypothetical protein
MAHVHDADNDAYYLDQLCLVGVCAAFAGVCLTLYFWQTDMLKLLLADQFHLAVLLSGVGLLTLAVVRSVTLWREAGIRAQAAGHTHVKHHHDHKHEHCGHDHEHEGGCAGHDHGHVRAPGVAHDLDHHHHDHSHADGHGHDHGHDHSWAPWRYVVLLTPIMLFLLGLPSRGPSVQAAQLDTTQDVAGWTGLVGLGPSPLRQVTAMGVLQIDPGATQIRILLEDGKAGQLSDLKPGMPVVVKRSINRRYLKPAVDVVRVGSAEQGEAADPLTVVGKVASVDLADKELKVVSQSDGKEKVHEFNLGQGPIYQIDFKTLVALAFNPVAQREWAGRTVRVLAQLLPQGDRFFALVRFRRECCAADAIQVEIPARLSHGSLEESPTRVQKNDWVRVTGRVEFFEQRGRASKRTVLVVQRPRDVEKSTPDPNPYIQ